MIPPGTVFEYYTPALSLFYLQTALTKKLSQTPPDTPISRFYLGWILGFTLLLAAAAPVVTTLARGLGDFYCWDLFIK